MIDINIQEPSPLCTFMEQLGKSIGSIEIVSDNACSHSNHTAAIRRNSEPANKKDTNNRWDAVYRSSDYHATRLAYGRPSDGFYYRTDVVSPERAQHRWSTCDSSSSSLSLAPCSRRQRPRPPRRNSAEDERPSLLSTTASKCTVDVDTSSSATSRSSDRNKARIPLNRSWSSPTVCTRAPTFVRRLSSPLRGGREHHSNYKIQMV